MGSYNVRLIYPIGYSKRRCGATAALIRQPQIHTHNEEPEIRNRMFMGRGPIFRCRRKPEYPEKTYQGEYGSAHQIHIQPLASYIGDRKVYEHKTNPPRHWSNVPS